jgi:hydroxybutyrate-dimer hydrolase
LRGAPLAGLVLAACLPVSVVAAAAPAGAATASAQPAMASAGTLGLVSRLEVDGVTDDLLTAGLGLQGLRAATPPGFADPRRPTPAELRRRAIYVAWRGLVDLAPGGGAGVLFGPQADERIAGVELTIAVRAPGGRGADLVMLQLPRAFDPRDPCVVAAASSGSRGIYGALPTAAEWGLRNGCAVVTTDKGTGNGFFDHSRRAGIRVDGVATTDLADPLLGFLPDAAAPPPAPWRLSSKHAHGGVDPETQWGERLITATRVGFEWLNVEYRGRLRAPLTPANTRVIASGISNGGAVVLRALELDRGPVRERWFDAAVVSEPNAIVAAAMPRLRLAAPGAAAAPAPAATREVAVRGLLDYATLHGLLQPCAVLAETDPAAPFAALTAGNRPFHEAWCADLAAHGEVAGASAQARAADARARLLEAGVGAGALRLGHLNVQSQLWSSIAVTYLNAAARAGVAEAPCGLGFAAVDAGGAPRALTDEEWARLSADGTGIPPTAGIAIVRDDGSPANAPGAARCLRAWVDAAVSGSPVVAARVGRAPADFAARLRDGLAAIQMRADPGRRPVIVLHGRLDGLIPVNHSSRPWYAAAVARDPRAELRYYEVAHGQHFDAFLGLPGLASAYVPMQPYLLAAMDLMAARLRGGAALPPSQVLRSAPRDVGVTGEAAPLGAANLGGWQARPGAGERIELRDGALRVPE